MRRLVAALVAALTVTLVSTLSPTAQAARAGDPNYHKPVVGECHDYGYSVMMGRSDTSPTVPCTDPHTAKVIVVAMLPNRIDWSDLSKVYGFMNNKCGPARETWLGRTVLLRGLTAYDLSYFIPTADEQAQGARWVRCDAFLWHAKKLGMLPYDAAPLVPKPLTDDVRRCLTSTWLVTTCDASHIYRATADFLIRKAGYPSRAVLLRMGRAKCPKLTGTQHYVFHSPTKAEWKIGLRFTVCYSKTRS
jgi:hypothetical protein